MGRVAALWFLSCLLAFPLGAPLRAAETAPDWPDAAGMARAYGFAPDQVGVTLRRVDGTTRQAHTLAAHRAEATFIPASVAKLATAVAALEVLGGDHRFMTRVRGRGEIVDGRLQGDLILEGGGDPLLGADGLLALCESLRAAGVRTVEGRFLLDDSRYRRQAVIAESQPGDATYNPGVSALSSDFNRVRVLWEPADAEGIAARTLPALPGLRIAANADAAAPRQGWRAEMHAETGALQWRPAPDVPARGGAWLPVKRPAQVTGALFRRLCARTGLSLPAPGRIAPADTGAAGTVLARHPSQPVGEIVKAMLAYSNNLVAELLGLATARELTGRPVSLAESAAILREWWRARLPEGGGAFDLGNHSGLNAQGQASPARFADILAHAHARRYAAPAGTRRGLISLLPAAGWGGGLGDRLRDPASAFNVWAKTGTMNYASGLAGYLLAPGGGRYAFAVFVTDAAARAAYDAAPDKRAPSLRRDTAGWIDRAKAFEAAMVRGWMRALDPACGTEHAAQQQTC